MFGLWYSLFGMVFGILCALKANEKNRTVNDWFILGFIFSIMALILISVLPKNNKSVISNFHRIQIANHEKIV